ncbi:MAG: lysylphosphatidylglycerol synthase transmembrane domain-containing protein, partial [Bacteroidota bacterium]|nr:lysylphosphatidylglycerol synthase transmembrane domain-containing protein [Bacteroidota bacterium]
MKDFFSSPIVSTTLKIMVSAVLLGGLLFYLDVRTISASFKSANPYYLTIGLSLAVFQLIIHFYRWRYLLRLVEKEISNKETFTSFFVGFMVGFFTPAQLGEFVGRIASHPNVKKSHIIAITIVDKLYWFALTIIVGGTGLAMFVSTYYGDFWSSWYRYLITIVMSIIIVIFLYPQKIKELLLQLPTSIRQHRFYEVVGFVENIFHNKNAWVVSSLTLFLYIIILLEYYFLASAFGFVSLNDALVCVASVLFVKAIILPISFGDLGVRESTAVFFFQIMGLNTAIAFNASII